MKVYFGDNNPSEPRLVYIDDLAPPPAPKPAATPARHARRTRKEKADINHVWNAVFDHMIDGALKNVPDDALTSRPRRSIHNWQVAVAYAMIHTGIVTVIITQATGDNALGLLSLAWHGACLFVGLSYGVMAGKL